MTIQMSSVDTVEILTLFDIGSLIIVDIPASSLAIMAQIYYIHICHNS
jgi:hypothetical protein